MGSLFSYEQSEENFVETNGQVTNNVIIQEARDTHSQLIVNEKLFYATCVLIVFEVLKLAIYAFSTYKKKMKKAYQAPTNGP